MVQTYPVPPLFEGHPLAIGVTSYDGHVYYGLTADRDQLPDAELFGPVHPRCPRRAASRRPPAVAPARRAAARSASRRPGRMPDMRIYQPPPSRSWPSSTRPVRSSSPTTLVVADDDSEDAEYAALMTAAAERRRAARRPRTPGGRRGRGRGGAGARARRWRCGRWSPCTPTPPSDPPTPIPTTTWRGSPPRRSATWSPRDRASPDRPAHGGAAPLREDPDPGAGVRAVPAARRGRLGAQAPGRARRRPEDQRDR